MICWAPVDRGATGFPRYSARFAFARGNTRFDEASTLVPFAASVSRAHCSQTGPANSVAFDRSDVPLWDDALAMLHEVAKLRTAPNVDGLVFPGHWAGARRHRARRARPTRPAGKRSSTFSNCCIRLPLREASWPRKVSAAARNPSNLASNSKSG